MESIPLIPKDQFMSQAIRSPHNIELLLALALDPQTYRLKNSVIKMLFYITKALLIAIVGRLLSQRTS